MKRVISKSVTAPLVMVDVKDQYVVIKNLVGSGNDLSSIAKESHGELKQVINLCALYNMFRLRGWQSQ